MRNTDLDPRKSMIMPRLYLLGIIAFLANKKVRGFGVSPPILLGRAAPRGLHLRGTRSFLSGHAATTRPTPDMAAATTPTRSTHQGMTQTLAGPFVIHCSSSSTDKKTFYSWSLYAIDSDNPYRAWEALRADNSQSSSSSSSSWSKQNPNNNNDDDDDSRVVKMTIRVDVEPESNQLCVAWTGRKEEEDEEEEEEKKKQASDSQQKELFSILQAVAVQWAAAQVASTLSHSKWQVVVAGSSNKQMASFQLNENPTQLFAKALEQLSSPPEWVEMVDQTGKFLGRVPRPLVHTHNLLHRGAGLFITKDRSIFQSSTDKNGESLPDLYVHQRTVTKRIFPSLYDMFVGGVAGAGESLLLAAQREVAEELGLCEPSHLAPHALLTCVVCTGYNRCVVDLYEYVMDTSRERISWQAEEVAWGSFCSYRLVEAAADKSLQRLEAQKAWPGQLPVIQSPRRGEMTGEDKDMKWEEWDFVPDGLLVWEAWLQWRTKQGIDEK